ncbi:MAG: ATP-binding cassette domain-containing protein [Solobacterium sp.]|nr:ATP-binding cassette domain-containing protein [Solobacterium sp.]
MNELKIEHLRKNYGKVRAIKDLSLVLKPGIYGLLGQNGAGKSTLMNILTTTLDYDEGEVLWNGKDIHKLGSKYREVLGYMPQQQTLSLEMNVRTFLFYMAAMKEVKKPAKKIHALLKNLNLADVRNRRLESLSGGMRQRVLIAQALLNDPQILLLDEPTAGLDPVERKNFRDIIADIAGEKIILIATHVISDVEFIADQIIMMKEGEVLTVERQEALMAATHVYETEDLSLIQSDPSARIVNRMAAEGKIQIRFISDQTYEREVPATMEDVYLAWLG